nr:hypothetical protein Iba_chr05cCG13330 [Ipomoea batatas]
MIGSNAFIDLVPIGATEVSPNSIAGNNVDTILGVVEGLKHGNKGGTVVTFFVNAGAVIVFPPVIILQPAAGASINSGLKIFILHRLHVVQNVLHYAYHWGGAYP